MDQKVENRIRAIEQTLDDLAMRLQKIESLLEEEQRELEGEEKR